MIARCVFSMWRNLRLIGVFLIPLLLTSCSKENNFYITSDDLIGEWVSTYYYNYQGVKEILSSPKTLTFNPDFTGMLNNNPIEWRLTELNNESNFYLELPNANYRLLEATSTTLILTRQNEKIEVFSRKPQ